jgi:hypothetical protein
VAKEKPRRADIDHLEVSHQAKLRGLRKETIYLLINEYYLSTKLTDPADLAVLKAFGGMVRSRNFARQMLSRFTKVDRQMLIDTADYSTREVRIRNQLIEAHKRGDKITNLEMCGHIYYIEGKVYSHMEAPDFELIRMITKIRKSLNNQRYLLTKKGNPLDTVELNDQIERDQG